MKKAAFICPFDLNRATGTPIRAKTSINSAKGFLKVFVAEGKDARIFKFVSRTASLLKKEKPEIIHAFTTLGILPALLYKIFYSSKTRIIFESHGWAYFELSKKNIMKRLIFLLIDISGVKFSDAVIAMSHTQKNFISKHTSHPEKISVVWGPVDFSLPYKEPEIRAEIVVGYAGNNSWWQGFDILKRSAKILGKDKNIRFAFTGDEKIKHHDIPAFLQSCDILVSPRLVEKVSDLQFPQKLSAYLSAGRPVIVSKASDQEIIVKKANCGFVLDEVESEKIVEAIKKFADLPREQKIRLGKNAFLFAEKNFSINVFNSKLRSLYFPRAPFEE